MEVERKRSEADPGVLSGLESLDEGDLSTPVKQIGWLVVRCHELCHVHVEWRHCISEDWYASY